MSNLTVKSATTTVVNYAKRTPEQTHAVAKAYAFLAANGSTIRDLVALTADQAAPLGRNRIALLAKVAKENPDVNTAEFSALLKDATDKNRGAQPTAEPVTAEGEDTSGRGGKSSKSVPQGDATNVADLTTEQAITLLAELVTAHGKSEQFQTALLAAADFYRPVTLVATPATV